MNIYAIFLAYMRGFCITLQHEKQIYKIFFKINKFCDCNVRTREGLPMHRFRCFRVLNSLGIIYILK